MYRLQWSWDLKMCPYYRGVLISEGGMYRLQWSWDLKMCPYYRGVLISEGGMYRLRPFSAHSPQGVSKAVYKGLLDLLKYFLQSVEEELQKEPEASIFSVYLLLRLACSIFLLPKGSKPKVSPDKSQPFQDHSSLSFPAPISMAISPASLTPGKTVAMSNSPSR